MLRDENTPPYAPFLAMAIELANKKIDYQRTIEVANQIARAPLDQVLASIDFKKKETGLLHAALQLVIQSCVENYDNIDELPLFSYDTIHFDELAMDANFIRARDIASSQLYVVPELTANQKLAVLVAFQFIFKRGTLEGNFGTPVQLEQVWKNSRSHFADKIHFETYRIHIKDRVHHFMDEHERNLLQAKIDRINEITAAAAMAYKECDDKYAKLIAERVEYITREYNKLRKKALKKAYKKFEIAIAAVVITAVVTPYLSAYMANFAAAEMVGLSALEAEIAIGAIEAISYATVSIATEAVLNNNYKGLHEKYFKRVAVSVGASLTGSLVAGKPTTEIVKGSTEAMKSSAASYAVRDALHSMLNHGKTKDTLKSAFLGGVTGAAGEKLTAELGKFDTVKAIDELTKRALEESLKTGVQSTASTLAHQNPDSTPYDIFLGSLSAGLTRCMADNSSKLVHSNLPVPPSPIDAIKKPGSFGLFNQEKVDPNLNLKLVEVTLRSDKANTF